MWVFTRYGFFSTVCGRQNGTVTPDLVMIRARVRKHLEDLAKRFPELDEEIVESNTTDYRFRILTSKSKWAHILNTLGEEIDYPNFKAEVHANNSGDYEKSLHKVWNVMYDLQEQLN